MTYDFPTENTRTAVRATLIRYLGKQQFSESLLEQVTEAIITPISEEFVGKVALLHDALHFYADPDTYFAWAFIPDPPCGALEDDFTEVTTLSTEKPGKYARQALRDFWERETIPYQDEGWGEEWGHEQDG